MTQFQGILPAIVTLFDSDGRFDPGDFEKLLDHVYRAGVHGVYVCGQTGEGLLQDVDQRKRVAETAIKLSPRGKTVIVHIGAMNRAEAVDLARHASVAGAQAVSALPPIGNYSFAEIKSYYEAIAEVSDVPLLIYYFSAFSPGITTTDQILDCAPSPTFTA
jgi:N-acetylneuraminate lyase